MPTNRYLWQNFAGLGAATLSASSTESGRAPRWIKDQRRSKAWRSATGWALYPGFNDSLVFVDATETRVAFLDQATYETGAQAAAALQAAMNDSGISPSHYSPTAWYRAEDLDLADGADVTSWADASGNGRDLDTSVGTQTFVKSGLNGRPVVRFENDGYLYASGSAVQMDDLLGANGDGTVYVVAWVDSDHTGYDQLWGQTNSSRGMWVDPSDDVLFRSYDGSQDDATLGGTFDGSWQVFVWSCSPGTSISGWANDLDTAAAATAATGSPNTDLAVDMAIGGDAGPNYLKGYIAEVCVFSAVHTEAERARFAKLFAQKYGIDLSATTGSPSFTNTYTVSYSASTGFTLTRATGAGTFSLLHTDTDFPNQVGADLGFDTSADDTGSTAYTADAVAYQSRQVIMVDLGSAKAVKASVLGEHNFTASATVTLEGHSTDAWGPATPTYSSAFAGSEVGEVYAQFLSAQTLRYWRVVLDDTTNPDNFMEVGLWYVGSYFEPGKQHKGGHMLTRNELTNVGYSDHGAPFMDDKPTMKGWRILYHPVLDNDKTQFETLLDWVKSSRQFWVCLDTADEGDASYYVFLPKGVNVKHLPNSVALWSIGLDLEEAPL